MSEEKLILILANSVRDKKHCVAGKVATALENGKFNISQQWIRLTDPRDPEGAVLPATTLLKGLRGVRPLDIIKVVLQDHCKDPNHPEDCFFDPAQKWELVASVGFDALPLIADNPLAIWHDGIEERSVPAGYVPQMAAQAATLYLVKAPPDWAFSYWKEWNQWESRNDTKRKLTFTYANRHQQFSVTDRAFTNRYKIFDRATEMTQYLESPNPKAYFCLSLTKLTPKYSQKHYKICATIFEP